MEETRKLDLRPLLVVLAVGFAAVAIWAATAFAAGGSSSSPADDSGSTGGTPFGLVQAQDDGEDAAPAEDCPERDGGSSGSGSDSDSGSSSTSL